MTDRFSRAKEYASAKLADVSETLSTQRKMRGLRGQITDLVGTRDRLMAEMGQKVYALHGRGKVRNADLLAICERVDGINQSIDELNRQIQDVAKPQPRGEIEDVELEDESEVAEEEAEPEEDEEEGEEEPEQGDAEEEEASEEADEGPEDADDEAEEKAE
jgi:Mg-chelatase subunit ChlI